MKILVVFILYSIFMLITGIGIFVAFTYFADHKHKELWLSLKKTFSKKRT